MEKKTINNALSELLSQYEINKQVGIESKFLAKYILSVISTLGDVRDNIIEKVEKDNPSSDKAEISDFVERMYKLYPSRCPKRDTYLGKSIKDKDRIKNLLKRYTMEQIEKVIRYEVDTKYGKCRMYNFSTFLNNFPDPTQIDCGECSIRTEDSKDDNKVIISGVEYR